MPPFSSGFQLKIIEGTGRGQVFPLDTKELTIGRAANPGERAPGYVFLYDDTVSRIHAQLFWDDEQNGYILHHRSQTNPTMINAAPAEEPRLLEPDDSITIGKVVLQIQQIERRWAGPVAPMVAPGAPTPSAEAPAGIPTLQSKRPHVPMPTETRKVAVRITMGGNKGGQRNEFRLKVVEGPDAGQSFPLKGTMALGRDTGEGQANAVLLRDEFVCPDHAVLRWSEPDGKYQLLSIASPVAIQRTMEGLVWSTEVPTEGRLLLESQDLLRLGNTRLVMEMTVVDEEEETARLT
jgi:hypothetical protein